MVGDTGTEAGNKRQRGPLARKAWGASPASTARKGGVCVRAAGGAGESGRALCV